ncbi:MAG: hypothetical protein GXP62_08975, partial [Oligoflexia bacterium]|nr:hypothetical protein [Oligoflexia bacterium]
MVALLLAAACNGGTPPSQAPPPAHRVEQSAPLAAPAVGQDTKAFADPGGRNPPLPADNPVWDWDAKGFVSDPRWYGEHTWADVRMRVAGHITAAGRDLARVYASTGQWQQAADAYSDLARRLDAIPVPASGTAHEITIALSKAAHRDQDLLGQIARGQVEDPGTTDLSGLRARYLALALRHDAGDPDSAEQARALQAALRPLLSPDDSLNIDAFHDFDDRHQLRIRLTQAYLDGLDPIGLDERWDYWRPTETRRQALLIGLAASHLGGDDWTARVSAALVGDPPQLDHSSALTWPSQLAHALHDPDQAADFTVDGLGRLPTGDSLIDTGGWPGPAAIGTLERLGLD